jgi:hypothetical protein
MLYSKKYYKIDLLHWIVLPQLSDGCQHNYSTKARQAGHANEQSSHLPFGQQNVYKDFKEKKSSSKKSRKRKLADEKKI